MSVEVNPAPAAESRRVAAVFGATPLKKDPAWEWDYAAHLKQTYSPGELLNLYARMRNEEGPFETQLRGILFRAMCKQAGHDIRVSPEVVVKHPETMEFGDSVF